MLGMEPNPIPGVYVVFDGFFSVGLAARRKPERGAAKAQIRRKGSENMKKTIAWMLALCLLALGVPALAASGSVPLFALPADSADSLMGFAYDPQQGQICALGYERLYTMNEDGSEARAWEIAPYDLGEDGANSNFNIGGVYSLDGAFYALAAGAVYSADQSEVEIRDFGLHALNFDEEAGTVRLELALPMDGEALVQDEGGYVYFDVPRKMIQADGKLYSVEYVTSGTRLICLDPAAGSARLQEINDSTQGLLPYKEGKLLVVFSDFTDTVRFPVNVLDPATGDMEELFVLDLGANVYPDFFVYDVYNGVFYYGANGELLRVTGADADAPVAVAANPLSYADSGAFTLDGDLLLGNYEAIWRVNTDPEERPETRLVVQANSDSSLEAARVPFQQAHPEVEVVLSQSAGDVAQAMLTQTATPDIYTLYVDSAEYSAVFGRGYMAELTDSEILADFAAAVYPAIQEMIQKDGEVYGLPLEAYGFGDLSYSPEAFERLGLTEEDVPSSWMEFFDLLGRLPDYLENDPDVAVFEKYLAETDLRYMLFSSLMDSYMLYISQPENEFAFDTPLFRELVAAFEAVDFEALGVSEEGTEDYVYNAEDTMFYTYSSSFSPSVMSGSPEMLYLGLDEGMQPLVSTDVTVAFVNPFSQNRDLAIEYLECASEQVDAIMRITMMPGENEPVLNPYFEETLENYDEQIASLETQLLGAEEVDKQALEATLEEMQGYRDDFEKNNRYNASEESIAAYREVAGYMVVATYLGMDSETSSEYYEQRNQYIDGAITLDEFIRNIDQKLQMIVLEGM